MRYLLDTCVVSELIAKQPNEHVVQWIDKLDDNQLFLSVITIGEIKKGIAKLPDSARKAQLSDWLDNALLPRFGRRIFPINTDVMRIWGTLMANLERQGRPLPAIDSLIAATALHGKLLLVTRTEEDFKATAAALINPWTPLP